MADRFDYALTCHPGPYHLDNDQGEGLFMMLWANERPGARLLAKVPIGKYEVEQTAMLLAAAPDLVRALRLAEWVQIDGVWRCPVCDSRKTKGHDPKCAVGLVLCG